MEEELEDLEPTLKNLFEQTSLRWIFVGGKGGVGKTTSSCSIAVQLAKRRESVLLVSTDPAHNISDAFAQQFSKEPSLVNGFKNLYAMEIEASFESQETSILGDSEAKSLIADIAGSIPGIDEAVSFAELMKQVQEMNYSVIVFDTAPTGHTLRLLSIPSTLEKALGRLMAIRERFSGVLSGMGDMMSDSMPSEEQILGKLERAKAVIENVHQQFMDEDRTTFVCVCIPEFLSVYETERLVQELAKFQIDVRNIIINQVLFPEKNSTCKKCIARTKMQQKYINHVYALYDFFHITKMPLLDEEVRGTQSIREFSEMLTTPYSP